MLVIDYGLGNLHSIENAFLYLNTDIEIADTPNGLECAEGIVLPGVGAFGDGMKGLEQRGFIEPLKAYAESGRPLLGICLGMQFLFSYSEEFGLHKGLDLIRGKVAYFPPKRVEDGFNYKIPHIGWNRLVKSPGTTDWGATILDAVKEGEEVYFVHSYVALPEDETTVLSYTEYGGNLVTAVVRKGNIYGCQFHPEKSRETGLKILHNFIEIVSSYKNTA